MTDTEFNREVKNYISDLFPMDKRVIRTEFHINLQPSMTRYGGHFILADNEVIPIDIRLKDKLSCSNFANKIESFHRQSTNDGLNKWNKALVKIDSDGRVEHELIWDEIWEQEEIESYNEQTELVRDKWYWEEK